MADGQRPDESAGRHSESGHDHEAETATPAAWLMQALGSLPTPQRDNVLRWLLERIPDAAPGSVDVGAAWGASTPAGSTHRHRHAPMAAEEALLRFSDSLRGDYQMVPVRLPTRDHARLRDWSHQHGFAMATVIRGLLARFLDEQQPGPAQPSGAAD